MLKLDLKPRQWQIKALNLWLNGLKGVVSVVTGGGKTIFAQQCIVEYLKINPQGIVVIIVPSIALMDQWYLSLLEDGNVIKENISCFDATSKNSSVNPINIVMLNTARKLMKHKFDASNTFLIVDECHKVGSNENAKAVMGEYNATLGLSATPYREYDNAFREIIEPALGPVIYEYDYVEAHKDKVISNFSIINVKFSLSEDEMKQYNDLTKKAKILMAKIRNGNTDFVESLKSVLQRRASVSNSSYFRVPLSVRIAEDNLGARIIIFHEKVEAATSIFTLLKARDRSVTLYHTGISFEARTDNLRQYKKGVYDILVCCKALDEGLNVPNTAVAIIASSTASARQRIQRLGRILRPAKGKDEAIVYTLFATKAEQDKLLQESDLLSEVARVNWIKVAKHG